MKTQQNSILSVCQMRDNGCLVKDVAKAHGRKQMIQTPNGVQLPLIIKNGLPYLEHYYPTDKQMEEIKREEWMTLKGTWDLSKLDDIPGASDRSISQFSPIPMDAIDSFYNSQGEIRATKSDSTNESIVSDSPRDPVVSDSTTEPTASDSMKDPVVGVSKKESSQYYPKLKIENEKEERKLDQQQESKMD